MNSKNTIILILSLFAFWGCRNAELPYHAPEIVVEGWIENDGFPVVMLLLLFIFKELKHVSVNVSFVNRIQIYIHFPENIILSHLLKISQRVLLQTVNVCK